MKLKRTTFKNPTPPERKAVIANLKWWLFDRFGYFPHAGQLPFHESLVRIRNIIAGTRGGKSLATGEEAVPYLFAGAVRIWVVGQSYALTEKEFRYIYERMVSEEVAELFGGTPLERDTYNVKGGDMYLRTTWGAEVQCISLEKADIGAFGEEVDLMILSEAAQIKNPKMKWERVLRGRVASRLGDLIIPTTPAGRAPKHDPDGWLLDMYEKGLDPSELNHFTIQFPSWANPHFPEDPYEIRRTMDPKVFAEQYEGQFVSFSGAVYGGFDEHVHVISPFEIPPHWMRYEAIDPGFSGKFVWLSSVISEQGNVYIVDEYSDSECLYEERIEAINQCRASQYNTHPSLWVKFCNNNKLRTTTYIDPEDAQCRAEFIAKGLPCVKANNNIWVGIDRVARRLNYSKTYAPSLYITANCTDTIEALKMHSWGQKTSLDTRKPANDKWKHWADCVRYICAGYLIPSLPKVPEAPTEEGLWSLIEEAHASQNRHPHDMSAYERRASV